jgi:exosortase/archaeosortase family protein
MQLEQWVIQGLMRFVAAATVEFAGWLGIPALQHGNLVEIGGGMVGIDEACSGVRSLQSGLMIALFLGEQFRFSLMRRMVLLLASIALVVLANMGRTTFLVWAAAERGFEQMERWHDSAGYVVMWIVLPGLFLLGWLIRPRRDPAPELDRTANGPGAVPVWMGGAALGWIALCLLATEAWYRTHETRLVPNQPWTVAWPKDAPQFQEMNIPDNALAILRCDKSQTASWQDELGNEWSAFLLRWDAGENSAQLARGHRPEICLTAVGARLLDDLGRMPVAVHGVELDFHHLTFESGRQLMHVFYCIWEDRVAPEAAVGREDGSRSGRLMAVFEGKRHLGQQVFEVVLVGPESIGEARRLLEEQTLSLVRTL